MTKINIFDKKKKYFCGFFTVFLQWIIYFKSGESILIFGIVVSISLICPFSIYRQFLLGQISCQFHQTIFVYYSPRSDLPISNTCGEFQIKCSFRDGFIPTFPTNFFPFLIFSTLYFTLLHAVNLQVSQRNWNFRFWIQQKLTLRSNGLRTEENK